ncbi:MAG: uncharacterized protein QOI34_1003 [Verrucomicrobiota bacterium]|jgi:uncharacterized protein (DUF697 family)
MNRSLFLHVVERLEGLVGKLPATIQKPILSELTPMKELFLQQRPPRFLFTGPNKIPLTRILSTIFPEIAPVELREGSTENLWREFSLPDRGTISVFDAREMVFSNVDSFENKLQKEPADVVFFFDDPERRKIRKDSLEDLQNVVSWNDQTRGRTTIVAVVLASGEPAGSGRQRDLEADLAERASRLQAFLDSNFDDKERLLRVFTVRGPQFERDTHTMFSLIARHLPNEARIEIARISGDREAQKEIAQLLVKSTTAVCTAIGAQPIPLADLPILTTLQLVMVSGIMYVSGRERSLRAATEFIAALGANVGAGMLLREGTRAILKFFPGWGNLVCGMVAGAGTYAIGRSAIAYFLEGVSLKDARRTYLANRKKSPRAALSGGEPRKQQREDGSEKPRRRLRLGR